MTARVVIVGGGYVGLYAALGLERRLQPGEAEVTLVNPESYMTYQPFLPEAASGNIEPRHVVVPLRTVLRRTRVVVGQLASLDHARQKATLASGAVLDYDHVVIALGSISRVLPVPGLSERGVGFKTVAEAIHLRNHVLSCMDRAESTTDREARRRLLTFCFVGGGYAGVEALAELEDLARDACRLFSTIDRDEMRWVLVEAMAGILPEIGAGLGDYAIDRLRRRGIEVHLNTRLESAEGGVMKLSNGESFASETLVWTTGVAPHPLLRQLGLPLDDRGRLAVDEFLRLHDHDDAWAGGDGAAVPDLTTGGVCPPTAQHALRQGRRLAANVSASLRGQELAPFRYRNKGGLVSLGRYKGVARVGPVRMKGAPAWFLHRTYHVLMVPTFNRKARILADWTVALFFKRDVVQLGSLAEWRKPLADAIGEGS